MQAACDVNLVRQTDDRTYWSPARLYSKISLQHLVKPTDFVKSEEILKFRRSFHRQRVLSENTVRGHTLLLFKSWFYTDYKVLVFGICEADFAAGHHTPFIKTMLVYHVILYMFSDIKCNHSALQFGAEGACQSYASWRMSTSFFKTLCASVRVSTSQFREVRTSTDMKLSAKWEPGARAFSTISAQHATLPLQSDPRARQGNRKAQYLDTLHQFLEAEKHFFVCPGAATPHIPDNPPHSWPVVATCRHLGNGGLTSSLRCIEAKSAVKKTGKYIAKTKCLATLQLLRQFQAAVHFKQH